MIAWNRSLDKHGNLQRKNVFQQHLFLESPPFFFVFCESVNMVPDAVCNFGINELIGWELFLT